MKKTKIFGALAAAVVVLAAAQPVFAASVPGNGANTTTVGNPTAEEIASNGETTVGIMEARMDPSNISYEVPLYVTVAAVKGSDELKAPSNYKITNTSKEDGNKDAYDIAVTGMSFQRVAAATWDTVSAPANVNTGVEGNHTATKPVYLVIGGVAMPATKGATTEQVVDLKTKATNPTYAGFAATIENAFYDATGKYTQIAPKASLNLPIYGQVKNEASRVDTQAAAQFKIKYTVAAVVKDGTILGNVYAGDNSVTAGLGTWDDGTKTFTKATAQTK